MEKKHVKRILSPRQNNKDCIKPQDLNAAKSLLAILIDSPVKYNNPNRTSPNKSRTTIRNIDIFPKVIVDKLDEKDIATLLLSDDSDVESSPSKRNRKKKTSIVNTFSPNQRFNCAENNKAVKSLSKSKECYNIDEKYVIICENDKSGTPKKTQLSRLCERNASPKAEINSTLSKSIIKVSSIENKAKRSITLRLDSPKSNRYENHAPLRLKLKRKAPDEDDEDERACKQRKTESDFNSPSNDNKERTLRCRENINLPKWRIEEVDSASSIFTPNKSARKISSPATQKLKITPNLKQRQSFCESSEVSNVAQHSKTPKSESLSKRHRSSLNCVKDAEDIRNILSSPKCKLDHSERLSLGKSSGSKNKYVKKLFDNSELDKNKVKLDSESSSSTMIKSDVSNTSSPRKLSTNELTPTNGIRKSRRLNDDKSSLEDSDSDEPLLEKASLKRIASPIKSLPKVIHNKNVTATENCNATSNLKRSIRLKYKTDSSESECELDQSLGKRNSVKKISSAMKSSPKVIHNKNVKIVTENNSDTSSPKRSIRLNNKNNVNYLESDSDQSKYSSGKKSSSTNSSPKVIRNKIVASKKGSSTSKSFTIHSKQEDRKSSSPKVLESKRNLFPLEKNSTPSVTLDSLESTRHQLLASTIPQSLPCRDKEFNNIFNFIARKIEDMAGGCMYISGVPGTGKTATVHAVVKRLQMELEKKGVPNFDFVEINALRLTEPRQAYVRIWQSLTGFRLTAEQAQRSLDHKFSSRAKKPTVLLVDELDYLCTRRQDVVYNILDWPMKQGSGLVILTIANTMDLPERTLKGKVTSRMGLTRVVFQPYTHHQLQEIVMNRISDSKSFHPDAVQLVARKVAAVSGDARRALDICRRSTDLIGSSGIVTIQVVEQALKQLFSGRRVLAIKSCSVLAQLVLRALRDESLSSGVDECNVRKFYQHLLTICTLEGVEQPTVGTVLSVTTTLENLGLIVAEKKGRPDLVRKLSLNVSADDIHYALSC